MSSRPEGDGDPRPSSAPIVRTQDRLLVLLGSSPSARVEIVGAMLRRDPAEALAYWLQLVVSVGIATLGLVVGSAAVIIGAMLVAPLMGPIVGLAMGLAAGSPYLVLRTSGRIGLSVLLAVVGASAITVLVPFHDLNGEIAARASPTVLDLATAAFCAVAGLYAAVGNVSGTASAAAGTSIGISLVPPLCVAGYSVGTHDQATARGAGLLFLTNLVAIVVVGTVGFLLMGFNRVDVSRLEREELGRAQGAAPIAARLARPLARLFESRWGPFLRFLMPFLLLASVYVPLRRALDDVAWQIAARGVVSQAISRTHARVVETRIHIERRNLEVALVVLGDAVVAEEAKRRITAEVLAGTGVTPRLEVLAVPDADAIAGLRLSLLERTNAARPPPPAPPPAEQFRAASERLRTAVLDVWPREAVGDAVSVSVDLASGTAFRVRVVHVGSALPAATKEILERVTSEAMGVPVRFVDVALPAHALTRSSGDGVLVASLIEAVERTTGIEGFAICVELPGGASMPRREAPADARLRADLLRVVTSAPRAEVRAGEDFRVVIRQGDCPALGADADPSP